MVLVFCLFELVSYAGGAEGPVGSGWGQTVEVWSGSPRRPHLTSRGTRSSSPESVGTAGATKDLRKDKDSERGKSRSRTRTENLQLVQSIGCFLQDASWRDGAGHKSASLSLPLYEVLRCCFASISSSGSFRVAMVILNP